MVSRSSQQSRHEHYLHVLLYYFRKGKNADQARRKLIRIYGENALPDDAKCIYWYKRFRSKYGCRFTFDDASGYKEPVEADKDKIITPAITESKSTQTTEQLSTKDGPPTPDVHDTISQPICITAPEADEKLPCTLDITGTRENEEQNENEDENDKVEFLDECVVVESSSAPTASESASDSIKKDNAATITHDEETDLRIQLIKEGIEQQNELHQKRMEIAETEAKIADLKLKQTIKKEIDQQRELHQKRMKTAETEAKIANLKLKQAILEYERMTGEKCSF